VKLIVGRNHVNQKKARVLKMGGFVKGDALIIPFPFSNLSGIKRPPALIQY
jgi:hypothetical protein